MFKSIENNILRSILEWVLAIAVTAAVYLVLRLFVFRVAAVTGTSMSPTLAHGDVVLINRASYLFSEPEVGDIIAFPYPEDPRQVYVKRIIGMPGDTVDLSAEFIVNGKALTDEFSGEMITTLGNMEFPLTVPPESYFVLGDNRNGSKDSRYAEVGFVPENKIYGRIFLRLMPFGSIKVIK